MSTTGRSTEPRHPALSLEQATVIDRACRRFEDEWNAGRRLRLEDVLGEGDPAQQQPLLVELVALEVELRRAAGETPCLEEYNARFPQSAALIAQAIRESLSSGPPSPRRDESLPEKLGDFRVLREIGRGGMGVVYEAVQESLGRRVALKTLPRQRDPRGSQSRRLHREARAIARLHHSHIVDVFGHGEHHGIPFIAMRLIDGKGLDAMIASARSERASPQQQPAEIRIRARQAARIGSHIADALQYAHESGVLHRDIKPSNILLDRSGTAWLADFGLARFAHGDDNHSLSDDGQLLGTLNYLPPERLQGVVDARGDIYSLGLTLYEFLALESAFTGTDRALRLTQVSECRFEPLEKRLPELPRDLATILRKAVEREPSARYETAGQLADDLRRFLADEPIQARPLGRIERTLRWARRNRRLAAALATIATLLLVSTAGALGAAYYFRQLESKQRRLAFDNRELARKEAVANRNSQRTLVEMYTTSGLHASDEGRDREAVLWFSNAALAGEKLLTERVSAAGMDTLISKADGDEYADDADQLQRSINRVRISNRRLSRPVAVFRNNTKVDRLTIHPGGRYVLMQPWLGKTGALWDAQTGRSVALPTPADGARVFAWTPDGRQLAVGLNDRVLVLQFPELTLSSEIDCGFAAMPRDTARGDAPHESVGADSPWARIERLVFDAGGRRLAIACERVARVWDHEQHKFTGPPLQHPAAILCLAFSPDGQHLVTGAADQQFRLFSLSESKDAPTCAGPHRTDREWNYLVPRFTSDGRYLLASPEPNAIAVWEMRTSQIARTFESPVGPIYCLEPAGSSDEFLVGGPGGLTTIHPLKDLSRPRLTTLATVTTAFAPNRGLAFGGRAGRECQMWSLPHQSPLPCPAVHPEGCRAATFSADGRYLATAGYDNNVRLWALPQSDPNSFAVSIEGGTVHVGAFSPDSRYVAVTATCRITLVYDTHTGREVGRVEAPKDHSVLYALLLPDNERLAVYYMLPDQTGRLGVWNWRSGKSLNLLPLPTWQQFLTSPDLWLNREGTRLVTVGERGWAHVFDMTIPGGRLLKTQTGAAGQRWFRISPDGRWLCGASRTKSLLWNIETGEMLEGIEHKSDINDARFSPDGSLLATSSNDRTVKLWNLHTHEPAGIELTHPAAVYLAEFSPDGRLLLTICKDASARVWDLARGQLAAPPITGFEDLTARFRAGGKQLVLTDYEGDFEVWDWRHRQRLQPTERLFRDPCFCWNGMRSLVLSPDGRLVAVGGGYQLHVVSMAPLDATDLSPAQDLVTEAEVLSHLRLENGVIANLTFDEWFQRWQRLVGKSR